MKAISSADKANVISLLLSDHSIRKVESIKASGSQMWEEYTMNYKWMDSMILEPSLGQ